MVQTLGFMWCSQGFFYGDVLLIEIAVDDFTSTGFDIKYRMSNNESGKILAAAKTGIIFFDYDRRKITAVPEKFLNKIKSK